LVQSNRCKQISLQGGHPQRVFRTAAAKWLNEFRDIYEYPKIAIDDKLTKEAGLYAQHLVDTTYYKRAPVEELNGAGQSCNKHLTRINHN